MFPMVIIKMLKFIISLFIVFLFLIEFSVAISYGGNIYGKGPYGIGYSEPAVSGGSGGGSSGGGGGIISQFSLDKDLIHVVVKQKETEREVLTIKNTGSDNLSIEINYSELSDFMIVSEDSFTLAPGESKIVNIDFFAREKEKPEIYTGRIIVKGGFTKKIINTIIEIKERVPLFDLRVDILNKKVIPGSDLKFDILALNQGDLRGFDILLHYSIRDFNGTIYEVKEESIKIDGELKLKRDLKVPSDLSFGEYILYSKISYGNITASGIDMFEVMSKKGLMMYKLFLLIIALIIIVIAAILSWIIIKTKKDF